MTVLIINITDLSKETVMVHKYILTSCFIRINVLFYNKTEMIS